ncbi:unnamed protein product [[Candida] boidinii]|nr:unnamed protein product [[Candida] boidinii]
MSQLGNIIVSALTFESPSDPFKISLSINWVKQLKAHGVSVECFQEGENSTIRVKNEESMPKLLINDNTSRVKSSSFLTNWLLSAVTCNDSKNYAFFIGCKESCMKNWEFDSSMIKEFRVVKVLKIYKYNQFRLVFSVCDSHYSIICLISKNLISSIENQERERITKLFMNNEIIINHCKLMRLDENEVFELSGLRFTKANSRIRYMVLEILDCEVLTKDIDNLELNSIPFVYDTIRYRRFHKLQETKMQEISYNDFESQLMSDEFNF